MNIKYSRKKYEFAVTSVAAQRPRRAGPFGQLQIRGDSVPPGILNSHHSVIYWIIIDAIKFGRFEELRAVCKNIVIAEFHANSASTIMAYARVKP